MSMNISRSIKKKNKKKTRTEFTYRYNYKVTFFSILNYYSYQSCCKQHCLSCSPGSPMLSFQKVSTDWPCGTSSYMFFLLFLHNFYVFLKLVYFVSQYAAVCTCILNQIIHVFIVKFCTIPIFANFPNKINIADTESLNGLYVLLWTTTYRK